MMPKDQDNPLSPLINNWPALTALMVAAIGLAITQTKLDSSRPIEGPSKAPPLRRLDHIVPARLWQDPLSVIPMGEPVLKAQEDPSKRSGWLALLPKENELTLVFDAMPIPDTMPENLEVLFILAYVDPLTTANTSEDRRRERYALLSALNTAGYAPASPEKLSWFALPRRSLADDSQIQKKAGAAAGGREDIIIPFEWFRPRPPATGDRLSSEGERPRFHAICTLWVNEDVNQAVRLSSLADLPAFLAVWFGDWFKKTKDRKAEQAFAIKAKPTFAIAGRITSDVLREIARFASKDGGMTKKPRPRLEQAPTTELYLTQSTVNLVRKKWRDSGPLIHTRYVIGTDDDLAWVLVDELERRGIRIKHDKDYDDIAIISEWDTEYGQRMAPTFLRAASGDSGPIVPGAYRYSTRADLEDTHFYSFTYLRGLDGKVPEDKSQPAADDKSTAGNAPRSGTEGYKPTADKGEGNSQFDYLRRLVGRMAAEGKNFRAIGLLGSDVYDKLLLLQALRPSFPEAVFFTTDLDARLLQPADFPYTHNLLVASHYGLTLDRELQRDNPPFRSGYDTSSYVGYLLAVGFLPSQKRDKLYGKWMYWQTNERGDQPDIEYRLPHVYEIGRSGAYDLTINEEDILHPPSARRSPWLTEDSHLLWVFLGLVVFFVLLLPISSTWRGFAEFPITAVRKSWATVARVLQFPQPTTNLKWEAQDLLQFGCWLALLLTFALGAVIYRSHTDPDGEPMEWLEGISVWPTELLRWAAALLSLFFIAEAFRKLQKRNWNIKNDYKFKATPGEAEPKATSAEAEPKATSAEAEPEATSAEAEPEATSAEAELPGRRRLGQELWAPFEMWLHWLPSDPDLQKEWDSFRRYSNGWRAANRELHACNCVLNEAEAASPAEAARFYGLVIAWRC
jgi:hypothetical protein